MTILAKAFQTWIQQSGLSGVAVFFDGNNGPQAAVAQPEGQIIAKFSDPEAVDVHISELGKARQDLIACCKKIESMTNDFHGIIASSTSDKIRVVDCVWLSHQRQEIAMSLQAAQAALSHLSMHCQAVYHDIDLCYECPPIEPYAHPYVQAASAGPDETYDDDQQPPKRESRKKAD